MSKEEKKAPSLLDGPVEVVAVKRSGQYHVVLRSRVAGKVEESVLKSTPDKRIAADRLQAALIASGL